MLEVNVRTVFVVGNDTFILLVLASQVFVDYELFAHMTDNEISVCFIVSSSVTV